MAIVDKRGRKGVRPAKPARMGGWPPRWLTPVSDLEMAEGDGEHAIGWVETFCRTTKDSIASRANQPILLRDFQKMVYRGLLARRPDGRLRHRRGLIGTARKNGKSEGWGAPLALYGLLSDYPDGPQGREVYSCAGDRMQARIVFNTAQRMIEMEPELLSVCRIYRDAIEVPETGSIYRVLSAEAGTKEGLNPTLVIFDEVHVQPNWELWNVMSLAMGSRVEPLMVGITTAGVRFDALGHDTLCYQLYQHGQAIINGDAIDPAFYFAWWEPTNLDADHRLRSTWLQGNPGLADDPPIVAEEDFEAALSITLEPEFRTKRCNQWVASAVAWLAQGAWELCEDRRREIPLGAEVVVGFDGSFNNDATGIVAVSVEERPVVEVVEVWERPQDATDDWRVPIEEVEEMLRAVCRAYDVVEVAFDPARWARTFQALELEGLPVVEFPNSPERMVPACQRAFEAVANQSFTHNGDKRLARHIANAAAKQGPRGVY